MKNTKKRVFSTKGILTMAVAMLMAGSFNYAEAQGMGQGQGQGYGDAQGRQVNQGRKQGKMGKKGKTNKQSNYNSAGFRFGPRMIEELKITDEQLVKIDAIRFEFKKKMIDVKANKQKIQLEKREAIKNENFTKAKSITKEYFKTRATEEVDKLNMMEKMLNELTPEQRKKFTNLKRNRGSMNGVDRGTGRRGGMRNTTNN